MPMGPEPSGNSKLSLLFIAEPGVPAHRLQKIRANLDARIVQVYGVSLTCMTARRRWASIPRAASTCK